MQPSPSLLIVYEHYLDSFFVQPPCVYDLKWLAVAMFALHPIVSYIDKLRKIFIKRSGPARHVGPGLSRTFARIRSGDPSILARRPRYDNPHCSHRATSGTLMVKNRYDMDLRIRLLLQPSPP